MRIQCPHSDTILDLPDGRADMKFNCPACGRMHRVTVRISTPGQAAAAPAIAPGPRKYATGAFPPVVDIPIEADFVLVGRSADQTLDGSGGSGTAAFAAASAPPADLDVRFGQPPAAARRRRLRLAFSAAAAALLAGLGAWTAARWWQSEQARHQAVRLMAEARAHYRAGRVDEAASRALEVEALFGALAGSPEPVPASSWPFWGAEWRPELRHYRQAARQLEEFRGFLDGLARSVRLADPPAAAGAWRAAAAEADHAPDGELRLARRRLLDAAILDHFGRTADPDVPEGDPDPTLESLADAWAGWRGRAPLYAAGLSPEGVARLEEDLARHRGRLADAAMALVAGWHAEAAGAMLRSPSGGEAVAGALDAYAARVARLDELPPALGQPARDGLAALRIALLDGPPPAPGAEPAGGAPPPENGGAPFPPDDPEAASAGGGDDPFPGGAWAEVPPVLRPEASLAPAVAQLLALAALAEYAHDAACAALSRGGDATPPDPAADAALARAALHAGPSGDAYRWAADRIGASRQAAAQVRTLHDRLRQRLSGGPGDGQEFGRLNYEAAQLAFGLVRAAAEADDLLVRPSGYRTGVRDADDRLALRLAMAARLPLAPGGADPAGAPPPLALLPPPDLPEPGRAVPLAGRAAEPERPVDRVVPLLIELAPGDVGQVLRIQALGYRFAAAQGPLPRKTLHAAARLAAGMRDAGVDPGEHGSWDIIEGPGAPMAVRAPAAGPAPGSAPGAEPGLGFFMGRLHALEPLPAGGRDDLVAFVSAARALAQAVAAEDDGAIPEAIRRTLAPVLEGAYGPLDARDFLDGAFCRRLVATDYVERHAPGRSAAVDGALARYRQTLDRLEAGRPAFRFLLPDGRAAVALRGVEAGLQQATEHGDEMPPRPDAPDGDPPPPYFWRVDPAPGQRPAETVFVEPFPERRHYGLSLATWWPGRLDEKPRDARPLATAALHHADGLLAWHAAGGARAEGDPGRWGRALGRDWRGREPYGLDAWGFPLHLPLPNDQGDTVALAVPGGTVESPDFGPPPGGPPDGPDAGAWALRRAAQDAWLDRTARLLVEPGEMILLFDHFFRYALDSPNTGLPTLLGNRLDAGDYHQTVYESLDRKMAGRFLGDCDDLAEFFQQLALRQGRLAFVMSLPGHAACGWVDREGDPLPGEGDAPGAAPYRFVVLQTGPAMRHRGATLHEAVRLAYTHFSEGRGFGQFSVAAVPILLRFAGEQTATPFVLEARIYEDRPYAETMIRIQEHWHRHTYWAALREMEDMLASGDRSIGNLKETASLYERVGHLPEAEALRREELEAAPGGDPAVVASTWHELAGLYARQGDEAGLLDAVARMGRLFDGLRSSGQGEALFQTRSLRLLASDLLARRGHPAEAWRLLRPDIDQTTQLMRLGVPRAAFPNAVALFLTRVYAALRARAGGGGAAGPPPLPAAGRRGLSEAGPLLERGFRQHFFSEDDSWGDRASKYAILGEYALARDGRAAGLARLLSDDGPALDLSRDHAVRAADLDPQDWAWMRACPQLYVGLAQGMLDPDEWPGFHDPAMARRLLEKLPEAMDRARRAGWAETQRGPWQTGRLVLSLLAADPVRFGEVLEEVRGLDWSDYDDGMATAFGIHARLAPLERLEAFAAAFRRHMPHRQHHFKAAYRAIDKDAFAHALVLARSAAAAFPDDAGMAAEAGAFGLMVAELERRAAAKAARSAAPEGAEAGPGEDGPSGNGGEEGEEEGAEAPADGGEEAA